MDPVTVLLIVAASVVAYGTGFGATYALVRKPGLPDHYPACEDANNHANAVAAAISWPASLPGILAARAVRGLLTLNALPPAHVVDKEP